MIGGSCRSYYQLVTLGVTTGVNGAGMPDTRTVRGVRIGRQPDSTVPTVREIVVVGGQHGNEWESVEMVRRLIFDFASRYQSGDATVRSLLDQQAVLFVPVLNPDGYDFTHAVASQRPYRYNRQVCPVSGGVGVEINRSYGFAWGVMPGSSPGCGVSGARGDSALQATEANLLRAALAAPGYRPTVLLDVHSRQGVATVPDGRSPGVPTAESVCTDRSNCQSPDSAAFYRAFGTERSPFLRWPSATTVPYITDQAHRAIYPANGALPEEAMYGSLPLTGGQPTPNMLSATLELASPCGVTAVEHRTSATVLNQQQTDLRTMLIAQLGQLPRARGRNRHRVRASARHA
jgi:hypothetical protein